MLKQFVLGGVCRCTKTELVQANHPQLSFGIKHLNKINSSKYLIRKFNNNTSLHHYNSNTFIKQQSIINLTKNIKKNIFLSKLNDFINNLKNRFFRQNSYEYYRYESSYGSGGGFNYNRLTNVQKLIIVNVAVFIISHFLLSPSNLANHFGCSVENLMQGRLYTLFTCIFSHVDFLHLFVNMFSLSQIGKMVPMTRRLLVPCYIFCGLVSSLVFITDKFIGSTVRPHERYTVGMGASGAVFGLMSFVSKVHPYIPVGLFFLPFQFKLRDMFYVFCAFECYRFYTNRDSSISASAHLGGALGGYLFYLLNRKRLLF
ncbi:hypothetical protein ABK040_011670 [Willaertia magna]